MSTKRWWVGLAVAAVLCPSSTLAFEGAGPGERGARMSSMGALAAGAAASLASGDLAARQVVFRDACLNAVRCPKFGHLADGIDEATGPRGGQAETSVAVDDTGRHVVIGFNDTRGFATNPISVSGFMYSDDGGETFVDGGQLPSPGDQVLAGQRYPQIFGDPELKHLGGCDFIYASIMLTVKELVAGVPTPVQTLSVHRSRDCGHTWEGPFEVTGATNPNGFVFSNGTAVDAADKEFLDHDAGRGRTLVSWTNFTHPSIAPGQVQMMTTYSDDLMTGTPPTWSEAAVVSAVVEDGQSSVPRFHPDGSAVVAWRRFPFPGAFAGFGNTIAVARSPDGGVTWEAPVETSAEFVTMDQVLGNDRVNTSPSMAVDLTRHGRTRGNVYLVYAHNDRLDGADVAFQRSADGGRTFSAPVMLNARPGADRAQWFPWVTVDQEKGRVFVFYLDQGVADAGDLTQVTFQYSDDGGRRWSAPARLSERTFHAGWGNDTGQPNLGDYNQAVVVNGRLYASFAQTSRPAGGFVDGQPSTGLDVPDAVLVVLPPEGGRLRAAPLQLAGVTAADGGAAANGHVDPGETVTLAFTVRNASTNPLHAQVVEGIEGKLSTDTPGVSVVSSEAQWGKLAPGAAGANRDVLALATAPTFVPGTPIELTLSLETSSGPVVLRHTLRTGTPVETVLFAQDFEGSVAGWATAHGGGANTVPWTITSDGFCGQSGRYAFHANANDGPPGGSPTRWERLISPNITVPADSQHVTIELDVCYDTEEDAFFDVLAYDGFFLRLTDVTPGRTLRSVLVEAFRDGFTTGGVDHYPRHLPRSSNRAYFEDMSVWAGPSGGVRHVRMTLPGMGGSVFQLRFEFTQDGSATCADLRPGSTCGVSVDNIVVKNVTPAPGA